jgi:hypothetical protein
MLANIHIIKSQILSEQKFDTANISHLQIVLLI